ncbi:hypothetical protein V6N11_043732 [Hibiscus sabdariffa]|uniref:Uncharacterized protein n=1 Tax=Hibiscus sabdariffa TaxID=183260 RepID=A0ABR2RDG0_9ROSI
MAPETTKSKLDRRDFKRPIRRRSPLDGSDSEISCSPPHDLRSERWRSSLETPVTGDTKADVSNGDVGGRIWSCGAWLVAAMECKGGGYDECKKQKINLCTDVAGEFTGG